MFIRELGKEVFWEDDLFQSLAESHPRFFEHSHIILYHPNSEGNIDKIKLARKREIMLKAIEEGYNLIILSDIEQMPAQTAAFLLQNGIAPQSKVVISEQPGLAGEKITRLRLSEAVRYESSWMSTMVVKAQ